MRLQTPGASPKFPHRRVIRIRYFRKVTMALFSVSFYYPFLILIVDRTFGKTL
jgi:hypothetical protein